MVTAAGMLHSSQTSPSVILRRVMVGVLVALLIGALAAALWLGEHSPAIGSITGTFDSRPLPHEAVPRALSEAEVQPAPPAEDNVCMEALQVRVAAGARPVEECMCLVMSGV
jgi:uncharacterized membrane protein